MLAQKSPRFHQIASNKSKISQGSMPLVCHMLCTRIRTCPPPPITHTISFCPPLGKKLKETLLGLASKVHVKLSKLVCLDLASLAPE